MQGEGLWRRSEVSDRPELRPIARDLRTLIRDIEAETRARDHDRVNWDAEALRNVLHANLRGQEVIVVSNREPYIHDYAAGSDEIVVRRPASGLVTALEPIMRACSGTWIAHGGGSADRDVVDQRDRVGVPHEKPAYQLRRVWLTEEEEAGYYYGFANEGLWPLCHIAHVRPVFRTADWEQYVKANRKFATAVQEESKSPDPIVLVQDYHFALLPRMIRDAHAGGDDHHVLAHPVAEPGSVRHLPVARGSARRPARQQHPRLPHAIPLQQLRRHRRPADRGAR